MTKSQVENLQESDMILHLVTTATCFVHYVDHKKRQVFLEITGSEGIFGFTFSDLQMYFQKSGNRNTIKKKENAK